MKRRFLKRTYKLTFINLLFVLLSSCYLIPCNYYSDLNKFNNKPNFKQLVGNYQLDIEPPASRAQAQLILKKDSTFILKEVPVGVLNVFNSDFEQDDNSLENIIGTWQISDYGKETSLSVDINWSQIDEKLDDSQTSWKLYEKDNKPIVLIILGDPDSCESLKFIKKN